MCYTEFKFSENIFSKVQGGNTEMFVGREKELAQLIKIFHSAKKETVLIYGKRRIGKSTLISEAAKGFDGKVIAIVCIRSTFHGNIGLLSRNVSLALGLPDLHMTSLADIFHFLSTQNQKFLVVIDEYQYMKEAGRPGEVDSHMQNIIDQLSDNICLVLCGSYVSVMKELLEEENPLFGRFTQIIHLEEFDYRESALFYPDSTMPDKITWYSVFGGSPYVLSTIDTKDSLKNNVIQLLLPATGILRSYIENIMLREIEKSYDVRILEIIGNGKKRYSDIASALGGDKNGLLSKQLNNLMDMETIAKIFPINKPHDKKKSFYSVRDNLMRFYFTFLFGNDGVISHIGENAYYNRFIEPYLTEFISRRFEDIVLQYFGRLTRSEVRTDILDIGSYWYDDSVHKKNGEFDCVVKTDSGYEFYECKFYKNPISRAECDREAAQVRAIPEISASRVGFVCSGGFDFTSDDYVLITGDDLF